jgi:hypothetical protein
VQTCDANGTVTDSETCPLGCFEDQPRCRQLDPSNGLAMYVDMVPNPPDIDVTANGQVDTGTGTFTINATSVTVPSFWISAPSGGSPVRVFVVHDFHIAADAALYAGDTTSSDSFTGTALAIVATGTITIDGTLGAGGTAGAHADPACIGGRGRESDTATQQQCGASGGGGFATLGGHGGNVTGGGVSGGAGGGTIGSAELVPLRGGCPAGGMFTDDGVYSDFGTGAGGAIQLSAGIAVNVNGVINVDGGSGYPDQVSARGTGVYGGGSGGGILVEAPTVVLGALGKLLARGGGGGSTGDFGPYTVDGNPISGVPCGIVSVYCGNGGNGAAPGIDAQAGVNAQYTTMQSVTGMSGGGGGGGLGRIRINTVSGTYSKSSSSVEAGALTTGTVGSR